MKFSLVATHPDKAKATCLILGVYEGGLLAESTALYDKARRGYIKSLIKDGANSGKLGQTTLLYGATPKDNHVLLVGCGSKKNLPAMGFKRVLQSTAKALNAAKLKHATCYLTEITVNNQPYTWKIKQAAEVIADTLYVFDQFKSKKEAGASLKEVAFFIPSKAEERHASTALKQARAIIKGVRLTKDLANMPSNICTPTYLANQALTLSKELPSIKTKIVDEKEMQKLGMGALLGVTKGSYENAKLICLEYKGTSKKTKPIALVGKGITFDTGGISLKPADSMVGMKYDMCGAATVFGTIKAAAELKLPIHVVGIIPAVENMPGGGAYKPEDILTSMSGQTIEVISTDAEGRLILCDALTYAERYEPEVVIDIATLTGAVVIALGFHATGLVSNNDALAHALLEAGTESNDRAWQLPLWDEYQEQIKSPFADMANTGGRSAGTITAACFLSRFTKKFNWAHLDVAGTAAMMMGTSDRHATGRPVPMLMQYLINRATGT